MDLRRGPRKFTHSPRYLALRHGRRRLRALEATVTDKPPGIKTGEEQLYSFYVPGLEAGKHKIDVEQHVEAGGEKKDIPSSHEFNVIAPRFSLPDGAIYSYYPPQGHAEKGEVVPSVVFTDPTLPWERIASWKSEIQQPPDYNKNRVPWLAVLLFTQDELHLSESDLSSVFQRISLKDGPKQTTTLSINMLASQVEQLERTSPSIVFDPSSDGADVRTDVIFLQARLFNSIFAKYDKDGNRDKSQTAGEVSHHRFLAHLRHIHLDGMPSAATTDAVDHAFSVVVCHRTGPLAIAQPTTVVAHLVNIEGVEAMSFPVQKYFVAMSSLFSWEYTCLPPNSLNVADAFSYLGESLSVLRPSLDGDDLNRLSGPVGDRLKRRANDGFSLARYRVQTGEMTAAFFRGPFAPKTVDFPTDTPWPLSSTTGTKLQVLDQELNIMDITYSAAWNLGKTLGLANQEFATALSRVRKQILDIALNEAQTAVVQARAADLQTPSAYKTREEVVRTISDTISKVASLPTQRILQGKADGMVHRWFRQELPPLNLTYKGPEIEPIIDDYLQKAAYKVSSSTDGEDVPYNEHNTPYSTDWMLVLRWVVDRYHLIDVPPHYLITDPSHVPLESLRFFAVDHNWVSAMIDGGLSLANHLDRSDDRLRTAIKGAINRYLTTKIPKLNYVPPIPSYGFYVRSALVTKFPDLVVDIHPPPSDAIAPVILSHEVVDPTTMICLIREPPVASEFKSLFLREPPHQQYFAVARTLHSDFIEMDYKRVYTKSDVQDPDHNKPIEVTFHRGSPDPVHGCIFTWGISATSDDVRCLNVNNFATDLHKTLQETLNTKDHPDWFSEPVPTAALMGIQLNEPRWQLEVALPTKTEFPGLFTATHDDDHNQSRTFAMPAKRHGQSRRSVQFHPRHIACSPHPSFGDRKRTDPLNLTHCPTYYRLPRRNPDLVRPPKTKPGATSFSAGAPNFQYSVYPVGGKAGSGIPMLPGRQDLVFSIVYASGAQNFNMEYLEMHIPLAAPGQLMDNYTGTGPSMLSNLRFNTIAQFSKDNNLVLTLKPRSVKGYVPVRNIPEMSFLLSGVIVHKYSEAVSVHIDVYEKYKDQHLYPNQLYALLEPVL